MTIAFSAGVYRPQSDSRMLVDALIDSGPLAGRSVADLGTGTGVAAIAAAEAGADPVTAFDICPSAVQRARSEVAASGVRVDVRLGSWTQALGCEPFDVVVCNPPYVPASPGTEAEHRIPSALGLRCAWDGGEDGRRMLDPLCAAAPDLLSDGGRLLMVQSEYAGIDRSLHCLRTAGMSAEVLSVKSIPFGPVLFAQAMWLESRGLLPAGRRSERIAVIIAEKR